MYLRGVYNMSFKILSFSNQPGLCKISFLGIPVFEKFYPSAKTKVKVFSIPVYQKLFSIECVSKYLLGIKIKEKHFHTDSAVTSNYREKDMIRLEGCKALNTYHEI